MQNGVYPVLVSNNPISHVGFDYSSPHRKGEIVPYTHELYYAVAGFNLPLVTILPDEKRNHTEFFTHILHQYVWFLQAMHDTSFNRAFALQIASSPKTRTVEGIGAQIDVYLLCRVAHRTREVAEERAKELAGYIFLRAFPQTSFSTGTPVPLLASQLREILFHNNIDEFFISDIRKHEEVPTSATLARGYIDPNSGSDYIPHRYWKNTQQDVWVPLIEILQKLPENTAVRVMLEPVTFEISVVTSLVQQYSRIIADSAHRRESFDLAARISSTPADKRTPLEMAKMLDDLKVLSISEQIVSRAKRGLHVYQHLIAAQDALYTMRISLASTIPVSSALEHSVRASLAVSNFERSEEQLGWLRPDSYESSKCDAENKKYAQQNWRWLAQTDWQETGRSSLAPVQIQRLRHLVTPDEAISLFHVPVIPRTITTLRTADIPFTVPFEILSEVAGVQESVNFGFLYQRDQWLEPKNNSLGVPFLVSVKELAKPSLLVGAPGSGKTNLALYVLLQLWRDHKVPFLIIDPTNGHEYRYLRADPALQNDLVVYTMGDNEGFPLRFNPFAVPPSVTVRSHITRLLGCFKAAYEMWDPLPTIYESALARTYQDTDPAWSLEETGSSNKIAPCMADFAQAIMDELEQEVLPDYAEGGEAFGVITGASKIRVKGILESLGHILNVSDNNATHFFQTLLQRPVVIEMGALGDTTSISLVMSFLITQLAGHVEHAFQSGGRNRLHILLIEEAHRLLSAESTATAGANQGNPRGKSAEEINNLLAEFRKFGQGVMTLDQRPSSLVGGVMDNSYINVMCRLQDRSGFEHLSNVLNLDALQCRFAHSRLGRGMAIMLDIHSGKPVLLKAPNIIDDLRKAYLHNAPAKTWMQQNAERHNLLPPPAQKWDSSSFKRTRSVVNPDLLEVHQEETWARLLKEMGELIDTGQHEDKSGGFEKAIENWIKENPVELKVVVLKAVISDLAKSYSFDREIEEVAQEFREEWSRNGS